MEKGGAGGVTPDDHLERVEKGGEKVRAQINNFPIRISMNMLSLSREDQQGSRGVADVDPVDNLQRVSVDKDDLSRCGV